MLKHQQVPSGTELAFLYVKHLAEHDVQCTHSVSGILDTIPTLTYRLLVVHLPCLSTVFRYEAIHQHRFTVYPSSLKILILTGGLIRKNVEVLQRRLYMMPSPSRISITRNLTKQRATTCEVQTPLNCVICYASGRKLLHRASMIYLLPGRHCGME